MVIASLLLVMIMIRFHCLNFLKENTDHSEFLGEYHFQN